MIFKQWKYKHLDFVLIERGNPSVYTYTYFCGYVKVPESIDKSKIEWKTHNLSGLDQFHVFGGVTWFGPLIDMPGKDYYVGFDTMHGAQHVIESWTEKEAKAETEYLADQLYDYFIEFDGFGR